MFSLCIPTLDRFDTFLKNNLEKYLQNPLINEIIISDENGNDYQKIKSTFTDDKIKCYKNERVLGPFLNKIECCKKSSSDWIALIDSDNFADQNYFEAAKKFIENQQLKNKSVLMPSFARPRFNYKHLSKILSNKSSLNEINQSQVCLNTGNFVLSRDLIHNLDISKESDLIPFTSSCDVIYFNTLLLEQFDDVKFYIVNEMEYDHEIHEGSIYIQTSSGLSNYNNLVHQRLFNKFK